MRLGVSLNVCRDRRSERSRLVMTQQGIDARTAAPQPMAFRFPAGCVFALVRPEHDPSLRIVAVSPAAYACLVGDNGDDCGRGREAPVGAVRCWDAAGACTELQQLLPSLLSHSNLSTMDCSDPNDGTADDDHDCSALPPDERPLQHVPFSTCYAGFQFGVFAGRLGDGRCVTLLEGLRPPPTPRPPGRSGCPNRFLFGGDGGAAEHFELQLKGGTKTPFARTLDGRYVRGAAVKEFILAEVAAAWGLPSSRSLALGFSDAVATRPDSFLPQPTAVLLRLMPSSLRIGTFEHLFYQKAHEELRELVDFAIAEHFAGCGEPRNSLDAYSSFLSAVAGNIGRMIALMDAAGFVHGVLNTDNVSIHGVLLDFGPCDFISTFDLGVVVNSDDDKGMFAFGRQRDAGMKCVERFALAISPLFEPRATSGDGDAAAAVEHARSKFMKAQSNYGTSYAWFYRAAMMQKLGLPLPRAVTVRDEEMIEAADSAVSATRRLLSAAAHRHHSQRHHQQQRPVGYHSFFHMLRNNPERLKDRFLSAGLADEYRAWRTTFRATQAGLTRFCLERVDATQEPPLHPPYRHIPLLLPLRVAAPGAIPHTAVLARVANLFDCAPRVHRCAAELLPRKQRRHECSSLLSHAATDKSESQEEEQGDDVSDSALEACQLILHKLQRFFCADAAAESVALIASQQELRGLLEQYSINAGNSAGEGAWDLGLVETLAGGAAAPVTESCGCG